MYIYTPYYIHIDRYTPYRFFTMYTHHIIYIYLCSTCCGPEALAGCRTPGVCIQIQSEIQLPGRGQERLNVDPSELISCSS